MGLDFHRSDDRLGEELLFSLSHAQVNVLRDVFFMFKARTGVDIDEYGLTSIRSNTIPILIDCLGEKSSEFKGFLISAEAKGIDLKTIGD